MPEQNPQSCERCGEPHIWDGDTRENVCPNCLAEEAEQYGSWLREEEFLRDLAEGAA